MPPLFSPGALETPSPRVWLAAVGPLMLEAAGAVADGLICHPLLPAYLADVVEPMVRKGRDASGRTAEPFEVSTLCMVATGRTEEQLADAVAGVRRRSASTPPRRRTSRCSSHHGWGDLHVEAHADDEGRLGGPSSVTWSTTRSWRRSRWSPSWIRRVPRYGLGSPVSPTGVTTSMPSRRGRPARAGPARLGRLRLIRGSVEVALGGDRGRQPGDPGQQPRPRVLPGERRDQAGPGRLLPVRRAGHRQRPVGAPVHAAPVPEGAGRRQGAPEAAAGRGAAVGRDGAAALPALEPHRRRALRHRARRGDLGGADVARSSSTRGTAAARTPRSPTSGGSTSTRDRCRTSPRCNGWPTSPTRSSTSSARSATRRPAGAAGCTSTSGSVPTTGTRSYAGPRSGSPARWSAARPTT